MELLFEIGTEELPAAALPGLQADLAELAAQRLASVRLSPAQIRVYAAPRRLALWAQGIPERQPEREEVRKGPPAEVAYRGGELTQAGAGFARSAGVMPADLYIHEDERGSYLYARVKDPGRNAASVLAEVLPTLLRDLPVARKMHWGDGEGPFLRPVRWLLALLDSEVLELEAFGLASGNQTRGHRFLAPEPIPVAAPAQYLETLREAHVLADFAERQEKVWAEINSAAGAMTAVIPAELLQEVTGLLEWPLALVGAIDLKFLELPEEVLQTVMIHHQRFFPLRQNGAIAPAFVGVLGHTPADLSVVKAGYEKVLEGRLSDARFFYNHDIKLPLSEHRAGLAGIQLQQGLGSLLAKSERVGALAREFSVRLELDTEVVAAAAELFKADLATQMVYEFPELEGVMARVYATREGYPAAVAQVLEEAIRPVGAKDPLPVSREAALIAACDKADTLSGFFGLGKAPSGSFDPYGLRRSGIGLARILGAFGFPLSPSELLQAAAAGYQRDFDASRTAEFVWERLEAMLIEAGLPALAVRAGLGAATISGAMLRARLLAVLAEDPEFVGLQILYKRAANLAGDSAAGPVPELLREPEERAIYQALDGLERAVAELLQAGAAIFPAWDPAEPLQPVDPAPLAAPLAQVLQFRPLLDAFLDRVLVMSEDLELRQNRLSILAAVRSTLRSLGSLEVLA
jgi:glycyl-tRNA synthetase beta chain